MPQLLGWLIYTQQDYQKNEAFAQRFLASEHHEKCRIKLVIREELRFGVKNGHLAVLSIDGKPLECPDFVINRAIDPLLSHQLEAMGIRVFNSSRIAETCNDKARTYLEVAPLGLPMVDTLFVTRQELMNWQQPLNEPAVLKAVEGRGGSEVFLTKHAGDLRSIAGTSTRERFVLQKLCGSPGRDVRVFVVGKTIVGAILRSSQGDFKANFSLGGTARPYNLNAQEEAMVMKIVNHFDFGMVGIDFIFDEKGGFLFNEIEDVAGSRTLSMTTNIDIVKLYLEHIYNCLS
ncbi:MAG: RimK family alpha-L-glutamate ligase [Clostridia bacterium]|nr:RimK family alpha-L-glutamate ligase [Clostridia bacterium]